MMELMCIRTTTTGLIGRAGLARVARRVPIGAAVAFARSGILITAATALYAGWALAAAPLEVVSTLPTLTAIAREVGGEDRFEYVTLAKPDQDPHHVSPTPSLMVKTRNAALLIAVGMQLEFWVDEVADGSGNPRIFRGGGGRAEVYRGIPVVEVPTVLTRAEGDIHPLGNPHIWLDPVRAKRIAANIAAALARVAPDDAAHIRERLGAFQTHIDAALYGPDLLATVGAAKLDRLVLDGELWSFLETTRVGGAPLATRVGGWLAAARPLLGVPAVEYHKTWVYFANTFGLTLVGTVEEKPGIPPGPRHQRELAALMRSRGVRLILVDNFYDPSLPRRLAAETSAVVVVLPAQVGGEPGTDDYFRLMDWVLGRLVAALR